ncbi:MAG: hypothetical protein K2J27_05155 [Duncaniella sp.]|nr:hypothetical protein [Duncaniella sp.]
MKKNMLSKISIKQIVNETIESFIRKEVYSYKLQDIDKLYEYMRLDKEHTGLNNDILVDDCKSYKRDNHPLLIFVQNVGKEYVPISVAKQPKILDKDIQLKISHEDIEKIKKFVSINADLIQDFANEKISVANFIKLIAKIDGNMIEENKSLITEMATLRRDVSGLPMDLWLDDNKMYEPHAPRVKFRASNEQRNTRQFSSMLITNPNQIENMPSRPTIRKRDINILKQFVVANRDLLLALANKEINYEVFLQRMVKI